MDERKEDAGEERASEGVAGGGYASQPENGAPPRSSNPYDVLDCDAGIVPPHLMETLCGCVVDELNTSIARTAPAQDEPESGEELAVPEELISSCRSGETAAKQLRRRVLALGADDWLRIHAVQPAAPIAAKPLAPSKCSRCPQAKAWNDIEDAVVGGSAPSVPPECANCPRMKRAELAARTRLTIWGESWEDRKERIRSVSPFGKYPSWQLNAVVVKGGDDLRQELLASQVIKVFCDIFKEADLPLWLHAYDVLVVNSTSGFLEYFPDTLSVNGIKKFFPGKSLGEIFKVAFADKLFEAKQNFIESYAAYSLVVWFLQVKDRHNDNLLMMSTGHVVHLDFGFMLSNSPGGNMAFEQSPFKLTQEFLDVMDGECSDQYEYFRTLVIRGFLEARKHVDRIILPVRMLLAGSKLPCFREGSDWVLQSLHDRFFVNLTEAACIEKIVDLIDTSVNNWRTIQYDNYQRIVNGIL